MVRRFGDQATLAARGLQIWLVQIGKAHNRQTMTYGDLARLLGFKGAGTLANMLGHVFYYCRQHELPPLTCLVVNHETGLPGEGLTGVDLNRAGEQVYAFDWFAIYPPSPLELEEAYRRGKQGATRNP